MDLARPFITAVLLAVSASMSMAAQPGEGSQKCAGSDIANGPFVYSDFGAAVATFIGQSTETVISGFTIAAPTPKQDNENLVNVFPGQGALNECAATATATIAVLEIDKVGDADGNVIEVESIDADSNLFAQLSGAFSIDPDSWLDFAPGDTQAVAVEVGNPAVSEADYGDYAIKIAAKAEGYGIGVGAGLNFLLKLRAPTETDTIAPNVQINSPSGDEILGQISVAIQADDPVSPAATGLASLTAQVSSVGGAVTDLAIELTLDQSLIASPGVVVNATGTFIPNGGTGAEGTSLAEGFDSTLTSGIGTYLITAEGIDGAGNIGADSVTFNVNYDVALEGRVSNPNCASGGNGNCAAQFKFSVARSNLTSDGAALFDKTVIARLVDASNAVRSSHSYGIGSVNDVIQIDADTAEYQTRFQRKDIPGASGPAAYRLEIYFLNVDGSLMLQATSEQLTF